jgi:glycosyltransferase involved in cell wall biosynthesis
VSSGSDGQKVAFVYSGPRLEVAAEVAAGTAPDSVLLGENHLGELGYEATIHEPRLRAVDDGSAGLAHRLRWNLREVLLPWELGDADVVVTSLFNLLPTAARIRRRPRTVVLDFALSTILDRRHGVARRVLETSIRSTAAIVCLCEDQRRRLLERTELSPDRVHVVLLGTDVEFMRPEAARPPAESGYVLAVGKDLARDYRALAEAAERVDARFVLVTEERNLRGITLPGNVEVRRGLRYDELRDLYAGAACVALPLRSLDFIYGTESGGLTALLEAMAMAKPVVASDRPIVREYVGESCALVVPPEDPSALAAAIARVLDDGALAAALGAAGRDRAVERHTTPRFAQGLAKVFELLR